MTQAKPPEQFDTAALVQLLRATTGILKASSDPKVREAANVLYEGMKKAKIKS